jgi:hypothetical protein
VGGDIVVLNRGRLEPSGLTGRGRWRRVGDEYDVIPAEPYEEPEAVPPANLARRIALRDALRGRPIPLDDGGIKASKSYYEGTERCDEADVVAARFELGGAVLCLAGMMARRRRAGLTFAEWALGRDDEGQPVDVHRHVEEGIERYRGPAAACPHCAYPMQTS